MPNLISVPYKWKLRDEGLPTRHQAPGTRHQARLEAKTQKKHKMAREPHVNLVATALLVLTVVACLPEPAHAWTISWSKIGYYLLHPLELHQLYVDFATSLLRPSLTKVYNFMVTVFGMVSDPINSLAKLNKWKKAVVGALKARFVDRNPYSRCVKIGWPKCWKSMRGLNWFSSVFCPMAVYWECALASRFGRRGAEEARPYWEDYSTGYEGSREDPGFGNRKKKPPVVTRPNLGKPGRCVGRRGAHCPPPPRLQAP
ncbi:hypothetical protein H6P81_001508 [Aristolochia fimbriata]|uniref:Uncharacterized protein n=1 Tax=Aristolochia fimbriata TaxID=158543 RepID=A0AAV7F9S6_ARIFI|nr:hypothetical protein H6P81_001508 [Aristolochia fimbriata]